MTVLRSSAVLLLAGLSACTYMSNDFERLTDQSERRFGPGIGREYKAVTLKELSANAASYKHMDVKFTAIFNRRNEGIFVPFLTTFRQEDYIAFSAWDSSARLWEEADRMSFVPTLYLRKDAIDTAVITNAQRYALFEVRGNVMGDFDDRPFLLVQWVTQLDQPIYTDESLASLSAGLTALSQKRPAVAIDKLEKALAGVWSRDARLKIHLDLAGLYAERGDWEAAILHYEGALANDPENASAKAGLDKARAELERKRAIEAGVPPAPPAAKP
jgi:tetratricopeptide (TPR) repeat protein